MFVSWMTNHRALAIASVAVFIWVLANYWYLRTDIAKARRNRQPHKWSVDMGTKQATGGRTKANH